MCSLFLLNRCNAGASCAFAHDVKELRPSVAARRRGGEHPLKGAYRAGYLTGDMDDDNTGIPRGRTAPVGVRLPTPRPAGVCTQCTGWHNQGNHVCFPIEPHEDIDICEVCGARLGRYPGGTSWKKATHVKTCRRAYPEQWARLMYKRSQELEAAESKKAKAFQDRQAKRKASEMVHTQPTDQSTVSEDDYDLVIYTDGSCPDNELAQTHRTVAAGWGFVVWNKRQYTLTERYGPVVTQYGPNAGATLPQYAGAEKGSNNTGEATAVLEALEYVNEYVQYPAGAR